MNLLFIKIEGLFVFVVIEIRSRGDPSPEWMKAAQVQTMCDYVLSYLRTRVLHNPDNLDNFTYEVRGAELPEEMKFVLKAIALEALMKTPSCMIVMDELPDPIYIRNLFNCEKISYGI